MEQKEIIEGNMAIAEFMGMERTEKETGEPTYKQGKNEVIWASQLMYHSSWSWIMAVVKKIQQIQIDDFTKKKPVISSLMDVDIDSLWLSVIVFIKWYNQTHS